MGILFTPDDQYIRCFAHILNLVCQDALAAIRKEVTGKDGDIIDDGDEEQEEIEDINEESNDDDDDDDDGEVEISTATILKCVSIIQI
jgi:hypothetical protein